MRKLLLSSLAVVLAVALTETLAIAQARPENDPRFEKLAKEFYPKAKQEGALVVYTVWDVDHIRLWLDTAVNRCGRISSTNFRLTVSDSPNE